MFDYCNSTIAKAVFELTFSDQYAVFYLNKFQYSLYLADYNIFLSIDLL